MACFQLQQKPNVNELWRWNHLLGLEGGPAPSGGVCVEGRREEHLSKGPCRGSLLNACVFHKWNHISVRSLVRVFKKLLFFSFKYTYIFTVANIWATTILKINQKTVQNPNVSTSVLFVFIFYVFISVKRISYHFLITQSIEGVRDVQEKSISFISVPRSPKWASKATSISIFSWVHLGILYNYIGKNVDLKKEKTYIYTDHTGLRFSSFYLTVYPGKLILSGLILLTI